MEFRWIDWNIEHIGRHGIEPEEAEAAVRTATQSYPKRIGDGKYLVRGRGSGGRFVQVVFVFDHDGTAFVIHARPLTPTEIRRLRRESRGRQ